MAPMLLTPGHPLAVIGRPGAGFQSHGIGAFLEQLAGAVVGALLPIEGVALVMLLQAQSSLAVEGLPPAGLPLGPLAVDLHGLVAALVRFAAVLAIKDGLGQVGALLVLDLAQHLAGLPEEGEVADGATIAEGAAVIELAVGIDADPASLLEAVGIRDVEVGAGPSIGPLGGVRPGLGQGLRGKQQGGVKEENESGVHRRSKLQRSAEVRPYSVPYFCKPIHPIPPP